MFTEHQITVLDAEGEETTKTIDANVTAYSDYIKIVVSCSGGCVTAVYCTDENATAEVIDFDEFEGGEGEEERDPDDALDAATEGMACVY